MSRAVRARQLYERFEPLHRVAYFAPEGTAALREVYQGASRAYFAGRSAPLGQAPASLVNALFYNFSPARVAECMAGLWQMAGPETALAARAEGAASALRRYAVHEDEGLAVAVELLGKAARGASPQGRALFAANLSLPWPKEPVPALWHAATLLREHRGDGHVAALVVAGISGRESSVLQVSAGRMRQNWVKQMRAYSEEEWANVQSSLAERGLVDATGVLTEAGAALLNKVEQHTDEAASIGLAALGDDEVDMLLQVLSPIARRVLAGGEVPPVHGSALVSSEDQAAERGRTP
jgi:hypothetical protein